MMDKHRIKVYLAIAASWSAVDLICYVTTYYVFIGLSMVGIHAQSPVLFIALCQPMLFIYYRKLAKKYLDEEDKPESLTPYSWPGGGF